MKIQYHGVSAVDIPSIALEAIEPEEIIEVDDEVGVSLCAAGSSYSVDDKGNEVVTPAEFPLWTAVTADTPPPATPPAPADGEAPKLTAAQRKAAAKAAAEAELAELAANAKGGRS